MGNQIQIEVRGKIATLKELDFQMVGGNSDYEVVFDFDEAWVDHNVKTALFVFGRESVPKVFEGNVCEGVAINNATTCYIGVFSGDIVTTTPATICNIHQSITDIGGTPQDPTPSVYNQIIELLNKYIDGGIAELVVDQTYQPTSINAQSGKAVEEAIAPIENGVSELSTSVAENTRKIAEIAPVVPQVSEIKLEVLGQNAKIDSALTASQDAQSKANSLDNTIQTALSHSIETRDMLAKESQRAQLAEQANASRVSELQNSKQDALSFDGIYDKDSNRVATVETVSREVSEGIARIISNAPEDFDTLKELADWLETHGADASQMNAAISANAKEIIALQAEQIVQNANISTNTADISEIKIQQIEQNQSISQIQNEQIEQNGKIEQNARSVSTAQSTADNALAVSNNSVSLATTALSISEEARSNSASAVETASEAKEISTEANAKADGLAESKQDNLVFDGEYNAESNKVATVNTVASKVAEIVASAPEDFDTLKEVADYIASDKTGATEINNKLSEHGTKIAENETAIAERVKYTDYATQDTAGVVKVNQTYGTRMVSGVLDLMPAQNSEIDSRTPNEYPLYQVSNYTRHMIVPANIDYAVKKALADSKLGGTNYAWTDEEKAGARELLGVEDAVTKAKISEPVTTTGTGANYEASIEGITSLTKGLEITIIPHTTSTEIRPSLNVNGLGAKSIGRNMSMIASLNGASGASTAWLQNNVPIRLMYTGDSWLAVDFTKPVASDISGSISTAQGGVVWSDLMPLLCQIGRTPQTISLGGLTFNGYNPEIYDVGLYSSYDIFDFIEYDSTQSEGGGFYITFYNLTSLRCDLIVEAIVSNQSYYASYSLSPGGDETNGFAAPDADFELYIRGVVFYVE